MITVSLHPCPPAEVPALTAEVARAAFAKGCLCMCIRDALGPLFADEDFADLFPDPGAAGVAAAPIGAGVRAYSSWRTWRIVRPPSRSAPASTGSICWGVLSDLGAHCGAGGRPERILDLILDRLRENRLLTRPGGSAPMPPRCCRRCGS